MSADATTMSETAKLAVERISKQIPHVHGIIIINNI